MNKEDVLELRIIDVDKYGNGIARANNLVIFIKGALLNELVLVEIADIKKRYAIGNIIKVLEKSVDRKEILCDNFFLCGGCDYLHIDYEIENKYKEDIIRNEFSNYKVNNIEYSSEYNYRNKVIFHVKNNKIGFYKKGTNDLIEVSKCLLLDNNINEVYQLIRNINLSNVLNVMIRVTTINEIMICFKGNITKKDIEYLINNNKNIKSIYINDNMVYGNSYIKEIINDIVYTINHKSFMQVNKDIMIKLYNKIKEYASKGDNLLDLYCGTGTISIYIKDNYKNIIGVEVVKEAIDNANLNKKLNNISNIKFICKDASNIKSEKFDTVIVDPPRSGLTNKVINNLLDIEPDKIVYVSCNYKTLKIDIELLEKKYTVKEISIFNMFPRTNNIECAVLLTKKN